MNSPEVTHEMDMYARGYTEGKRSVCLGLLHDLVSKIEMSRTTRVKAGFYDEDIYYNSADFGSALDKAKQQIAEAEGS